MNRSALVATLLVLFVAGLGIGVVSSAALPASSTQATITSTTTVTTTNQTAASSPYVLTIVITTNNIFNSTVGDQPAYYVLGPNGLESSANISIPAHRLIKLVIVNYDDGAANLTNPQYSNVSGTQNGVISVVNNDNVNSSQGTSGININGGETVSSVSPDNIAHTFTVPQLNLNIPVPPSSVVTAYFTTNSTGTFTWFCFTQCGSGATGTEGAMSTPGWMTGSVVVS
ncbi:MAG: hypothetical protein JRN20_09780 [Nitrososphaerota archaeon]|nr:hypothetical protein [Nitrososphaerota archaeon]